ncbi:MAG TPA: MATE family efflux transporter, partial [Steroidobacteraceae bacterium]
MDSLTQSARSQPLPAQRIDAAGGTHVDQRAVLALALPLMANSAVQIVLNLTDMWFMGRISTKALAAVGAVQWLIVAAVLVLGGAGMAVQTLVAQYTGARRYWRAAQAVWTALWAMACAAPLFVLVGAARHLILAPFGFDPQVESLASAFWFPRMGGAFVGAAVWATFGFFNGIGRPRVTLLITVVTTVLNALLNQVFIFDLGWGIAGSAWATNVAQLLGLLFAVALFLRMPYRRQYRAHLTWRPNGERLLQQLRLGVPMGLSPAADLLGFAVFQMMQTRLGTVGGAATQMVVILTSLAYMPGFGIASAGTTLVGQSIGAGARGWALRVGTRVILLAGLYMGGIGVLIALIGPWLLPFFAGAHDAESAAAVALGIRLLWFAAAYQFFDGLNLGSSMCLRGAGDVRVPAALVLSVALL